MYKYIKSDYEATIPQDMLYAPDGGENSIRDYFRQRGAEDKKAREEAEAQAAIQPQIDELKAKYPEAIIREAAVAEDPIEELFELAVPDSGNCDSVGGEIVRSMMRILYRDWNDGDVFYEGYGKETCLPAVAYLIDVEPYIGIFDDFDYIARAQLYDDSYTHSIKNIANEICDWLTDARIDLFWTPNTRDFHDTPTEIYDEWEPEYAYEGDFPDKLTYALEHGQVDDEEVRWDIESSLDSNGIKYEYVTVGEYGYSVQGLNRDGYDLLEEIGWRIGEDIAEDYAEQFGSEEDKYEEW